MRALTALMIALWSLAPATGHSPSPGPPLVVRAAEVVPYPSGELPIGRAVPDREITAFSFATATVGYGLGGPMGSVYPVWTYNGGKVWHVDGPALFLPIADAPDAVGALATDGPDVAIVWGGQAGGSTIDVTTDGGGEWWRTSLGGSLEAAGGPAGDLWALTAGNGPGQPDQWLYRSVDGGRTWRYQQTLPGVAGWEADLVRPSASRAYALVTGFPNDRSTAAGSGIAVTTDGSTRWRRAADPCAPRYPSQTLAATPGALWLLCGMAPNGRGDQQKAIEMSADGGRYWRDISSDLPRAGELPDAGLTGRFVPASPLGALLVLAGSEGELLGSTDGGAVWAPAAPASVEAQGPLQVSVAGDTAFVLTRSALWSDNGGTWRRVS